MNAYKKYTLLCLGDSYTIGEAVEEKDRFPQLTVELLHQQEQAFEQPEIIAKTGWTTDELAAAIQERNLKMNFDFVTLLIGVNNEYRGRDTANYRIEFASLLQTAIHFAKENTSHVFVISIPDWGVTPFGQRDARGEEAIEREIDLFNAINRDETRKANANYLDITLLSRQAKSNASYTAPDGLHPSGQMYKEWAVKLAKEIVKQL